MEGPTRLSAVDRVFNIQELLHNILEHVYSGRYESIPFDGARLVNRRWFHEATNVVLKHCESEKLVFLEKLVGNGFTDYGAFVGELDINVESLLDIIPDGLQPRCRFPDLHTFKLELYHGTGVADIRNLVESIKQCTKLKHVSLEADLEQLAFLIPNLVSNAPSAVFDISILDNHNLRMDCATLDMLLNYLESKKVAVEKITLYIIGFRRERGHGDDIVHVSNTLKRYPSYVPCVQSIMIHATRELHADFRSEYIDAIEVFAPQLTSLVVDLARTIDEDTSPIVSRLLGLLKRTRNLTYLQICVTCNSSCTIDDRWVKSLVEYTPLLEELSLLVINKDSKRTITDFECLKSLKRLQNSSIRV